MALINRPMYEHFGARHLGVKGPGAMTTLEEGVMGVLPLDIMSDPAYWFIQGIRCYAGRIDKAGGGAGNYGNVGLSIQSSDEEIFTRILSVWVNEPFANEEVSVHRCLYTDFSSDPGIEGHSTDTRVAEAQPSQSIMISNNNGAATPGTLLYRWRQSDEGLAKTQDIPLILHPGSAIYFHLNTANARFDVNIVWVEIPAYRAEI